MRYDERGGLIRNCIICDAEINLCNGSILSCDLVPFMEGKIMAREFCCRCANLPRDVREAAAVRTPPLSRQSAIAALEAQQGGE